MRLLLIAFLIALYQLIRDRWKSRAVVRKNEVLGQAAAALESEVPQFSGYKSGWLCIRGGGPREVMLRLGCEGAEPCTWRTGVSEAGKNGLVFVSPCFNGFVLVISVPELGAERLDRLAESVEELQYFITHRVVEYHSWAKYRSGSLVRGYAYLGEAGRVLWDEGEMTPQELALGGAYFPREKGGEKQEKIQAPTEETVRALAAAWGMDPAAFAKASAEAGWLCALPWEDLEN